MSLSQFKKTAIGVVFAGTFAVFVANAGGELESVAEDEQTLFHGMPADEGRLEVFGFCGSCHSIKLVLQQKLPREIWDEVLIEMVEEHEMLELNPEIRRKVLDYLEKYYGPDS